MNVATLSLGAFATNCYLVWQEGRGSPTGALLVDCAGAGHEVLAEAERLGLQIRFIVITHGHIDHIEALSNIVHLTSAPVAIHEIDAPALADPTSSGAALFGLSQQQSKASVLLREGSVVSVEGTDISLQVLHTPGHTPGSICLLGGGLLFSGDTLFAGSIGRTDLPGGDEGAMRTSLSRLMGLPDEIMVYPGHGPATTIGEEREGNPWVRRW